jgi:DNA modification methylase
MVNEEQLKWLADNAGFDTHLKIERNEFDICVAALQCNPEARFLSVNAFANAARDATERNLKVLRKAIARLSTDGLLFIYGLPSQLAPYAVALSKELSFRYWIAVRASTASKQEGLRPEHTGLLLLSKPGAGINSIRVSHSMCRACGKTLKDWGGKSHLMNPSGVALSDVWMDLVVDAGEQMPAEIFERILQLALNFQRRNLLLLSLDERPLQIPLFHHKPSFTSFNPLQWQKTKLEKQRLIPDRLLNQMHRGKCLDVLKAIPSQTVDLAFADPPFNLTKAYSGYVDDRNDTDYIGWCKRWLIEYERVLKPGGALLVLNLPKWSVYLADFLSRRREMYLQNWIVWNSLPEPKGVLMPAHYSLLYFSKGKTANRFNYCTMENGWQPFEEAVFPPDRADVCTRRACIRNRRASASTWRGELTDIWYDIPRDRRNNRRAGLLKGHPCPTPEALLDRIIRLTTNPGDVVLDAFAGVGTTALVAQRLDRKFIAIEQALQYINAAETRLVERQKSLPGATKPRKRTGVTKRKLQLELKRLAQLLNRVPMKSDIEQFSLFSLEAYETSFTSWTEALKAAKIYVENPIAQFEDDPARKQQELFDLLETIKHL